MHRLRSITDLTRAFHAVSHQLQEQTRELEAAASRYEIALEAAPTAMLMVDPKGALAFVNHQAELLFGYEREELLGQSIERLVPDSVTARHPGLRQGFMNDPKSRSMGAGRDLVARRKDGSEVPVEIGLNPFETPEGVFVMASVVDISERRAADERFRLAIEAAPNAMLMVDAHGRIVLVNRQVEVLFGYTREELLGQSVDLLVPDATRAAHPRLREGFFREPRARSMGAGRDLTARRKDGSEVPVEIGLNPIETPEGTLVMASVVDISERNLAEERFRLAIEAAPNAMLMVDAAGRIVLVNRQMEILFGYSREELLGQSVDLLVPDATRAAHPRLREGFFREPRARSMGAGRDLTARRKDGSEVPVEIGLNPIETPEGTLVMASVVDISERKLAEERLIRERRALQRSEELEQFSYLASHDLQQPLRAVREFSRILMEEHRDQLDDDGRQSLDFIHQAASRMSALVTALLDYSRLQHSGPRGDVALSVVLEAVRQDLRPAIAECGATLDAGSLPVVVGYEVYLRMLLQNLVSNAVKFRRAGVSPHIRIDAGRSDDGRYWLLRVADNGIGIEPQHRERIFQIFQRLHSREEYEGVGIGLSHCKRIVELHEGTIAVESNSSGGSTFVVGLPRDPVTEAST